jgi:pimeloyl-ACP methyl ester carboxylesterase
MPNSADLPTNALYAVDDSGSFLVERDVDIPLPKAPKSDATDPCFVRANVFRPMDQRRYPVLLTYSPYGKDIPYSKFNPTSYNNLPKAAQTPFAVWEAPDPTFWVPQGYVVVRVDERGSGHSPGVLNVWSEETAAGFADAIEWAAVQPWSSGKVGILGVSYYASNQWFVAARRPKGLAAIVPWEGKAYFTLANHLLMRYQVLVTSMTSALDTAESCLMALLAGICPDTLTVFTDRVFQGDGGPDRLDLINMGWFMTWIGSGAWEVLQKLL